MSDMIERVARAVYPNEWYFIDRKREAAQCYRDTPHEQAGFQSRESADERAIEYDAAAQRSADWTLGHARAAIEAMREPSLKMVAEAVDNVGPIGCCTHSPETATETWQAMIDAALAAQEPSS